MEGRLGARRIPVEDGEWWHEVEDEYWQALLEQGEIAPEAAPPAESGVLLDLLGDGVGKELSATQAASTAEQPAHEDQWQVAMRAFEQGDLFHLKVTGANRGGILLEWNGLQGFVPASHLQEPPATQEPHERMGALSRRIGDALTVRLIEVDASQHRLVFSERAALPGSRPPTAILSGLQAGDLCEGTVTNLTHFGAFVDLGGVEGLIHISELSWDRVRHPSDVLEPAQNVQVYVLGVNPEERRIALSLKRLRPNPWSRVDSRYRVGEIIEGTVTNVVSFGAFVRVEEGLEGLIHVSELAEGTFLHPRNVVREGDTVRVRILNVDVANRRLGLSLRQAHKAAGTPLT